MRLAIDFTAQEKLGLDDFTLDAFADPFRADTTERLECFACLGTGEDAFSGDCGFCAGEGVQA